MLSTDKLGKLNDRDDESMSKQLILKKNIKLTQKFLKKPQITCGHLMMDLKKPIALRLLSSNFPLKTKSNEAPFIPVFCLMLISFLQQAYWVLHQ